MKRFFIIILFSLVIINLNAEIGIGLRNNQYIFISYHLKNNWDFKLEHSLFKEKIPYQYLRGYIGFSTKIKKVELNIVPYIGATYNRSYYSTGINIGAKYNITKWLRTEVQINPHYDSGYKYNTCYLLNLAFNVYRGVDVLAQVSNIPEFRKTEHRGYFGALFHIKNLRVQPLISIPLNKNEIKNIRVLASFSFIFRFR